MRASIGTQEPGLLRKFSEMGSSIYCLTWLLVGFLGHLESRLMVEALEVWDHLRHHLEVLAGDFWGHG